MQATQSVRAAARFLGCSYRHAKIYFKLFRVDDMDPNSPTLFEKHKNPTSRGIYKSLPNSKKSPSLKRIFTTGQGYESFTPEKIKKKGIEQGYLKEECYMCGMNERRMTDEQVPLLMNFKDGLKLNYLLDNLEMLCYNCYFLYVADPLTKDQIRHIEDNREPLAKPHNWSLSAEALENIKALGINI